MNNVYFVSPRIAILSDNQHFIQHIQHASDMQESLFFGDERLQLPGLDNSEELNFNLQHVTDLELTDACINGASYRPPLSSTTCTEFDGGIIRQGLSAMLNKYNKLTKAEAFELAKQDDAYNAGVGTSAYNNLFALVSSSSDIGSTNTTVAPTFSPADELTQYRIRRAAHTLLHEYTEAWMSEPLSYGSNELNILLNHEFDQLILLSDLMFGGFCITIAVLMVFLYLPLLRHLQKQTDQTHAMLLTIPAQMLPHIPKIRDFLAEYTNDLSGM
jgi:hypothetical protein